MAVSANDSRAREVIDTQGRLASERGVLDSHLQEVAEFVDPTRAEFTGKKEEGDKRTQRQFDSTAPLALSRFASAIDGMVTPRTQKYQGLVAADPYVDRIPAVRVWLEGARDLIFRMRYAPSANFAQQANEVYMSLGAYGTAPMFVMKAPGMAAGLPDMRYRSLTLAECYIDEDFTGRVDRMHRKFELTARQCVQQFGEANLPEKIVQAAKKNDNKKFEIIHCTKPNTDVDKRRRDYRGMKFSSYYVALEEQSIIQEGGYRVFPYAVPRYMTAPREKYGRSPAMQVLPDIKMLNEMAKTIIRAAHKQVDPPLLLRDDGVLSAFATRPGALNMGGVDSQGRQMVVPLQNGANIGLGIELQDQLRKSINDAFLVSLFQILVETPEMTATEAAIRAQEKGQLLAPSMGRIQSEFTGPITEIEMDALAQSGMLERILGPMPPELAEIGGEYAVTYDSPLTQAQNAQEGVAILRTLDSVATVAQIDPQAAGQVIKAFKLPEIARDLARINGMSMRLMNTEEEVAAILEGEQEQAQIAQLTAVAPEAARAAKDFALAEQIAGQATRTAIPGAQIRA